MKSFDDFRASLTPDVKAEISDHAILSAANIQKTGDGTSDIISMIATMCAEYSLAILEKYHEWLNS